MAKNTLRFIVILTTIMPFFAMADIAPLSSDDIMYIHRLHRIGYEVLKEECDALKAVDSVLSKVDVDEPGVVIRASRLSSGTTWWFVAVAILIGVAVCLHRRIESCRFFGRRVKLSSESGGRVLILICIGGFAVICLVHFLRRESESDAEPVSDKKPWPDNRVTYGKFLVDSIEYVDEDGWTYADKVTEDWLTRCVSATERVRYPLKRHMHLSPEAWNGVGKSNVVEALKAAPMLLKESKGIAIEMLVAALCAPDHVLSYWEKAGREVSRRQGGGAAADCHCCTKCGEKLRYHLGYYCPKCNPENEPDRNDGTPQTEN